MNNISRLLLETQALEIAPPQQVFWYTSGTVGPFYLNAHFLYGSRQKAASLLDFIDQNSEDRTRLLTGLRARVEKNFAEDACYRTVLQAMVALARDEIGLDQIDYISGGERRDWFFSLHVAKLLQKPALALFKDQSAVIIGEGDSAANRLQVATELHGARILHVADLITEASSYVRAWLPALENRGGKLLWSINVVDRGQGGAKVLREHGIAAWPLVQLGQAFFEELSQASYLSPSLARQLMDYHRQPRESMKKFLEEHPQILQEALQGEDLKIRQRARQLLQQNPYGFDENFLRRFSLP